MIRQDTIKQQLRDFRRNNQLPTDPTDNEFDDYFADQVVISHNTRKHAYARYIRHMEHLYNSQGEHNADEVAAAYYAEKFIRHIILRLETRVRDKMRDDLNAAIDQAIEDEFNWYDEISDTHTVILPAAELPEADRVKAVADVLPRGTDDIATIISRSLRLIAQFFEGTAESLIDVRNGFSYANVGIQALSFLYYPFLFIWKGLIRKDKAEPGKEAPSVFSLRNFIFWGITAVILALTILATFPPAGIIAWPFMLSIFTIALGLNIYRTLDNYFKRRTNRDEIIANDVDKINKVSEIERIENELITELRNPQSNPATIDRLKGERLTLCAALENTLKQGRELEATRKDLTNPAVMHGNKLRLFLAALTIAGAVCTVVGGPIVAPLGVAMLAIAGAVALAVFVVQQIKQYRINCEIEAHKLRPSMIRLDSTTRIFRNFGHHHEHSGAGQQVEVVPLSNDEDNDSQSDHDDEIELLHRQPQPQQEEERVNFVFTSPLQQGI